MSDNERREPLAEEQEAHEDTSPHQRENASDVEKHSNEEEQEDSPKMDKYDRSGPHPITGLIIFLCIQFVSLLFLTIATPIEMFVLKDEWRDRIFPALANSNKKLCVTAWGLKSGCRTRGYHDRDYTHNFCARVRLDFKIIEAFCIMAIGFMALALIACIFSIFQKVGRGSVGALGVFAAMLCLIPWGVLAGMFWQRPCCDTYDWYTSRQRTVCDFDVNSGAYVLGEAVPRFKEMSNYGAGFGLIVTAWCLQVIACVFAFVPL